MTAAELAALVNQVVIAAIGAQGAQYNQPGCTYKAFMDCKPHIYNGSRVEKAVGLVRWFEKTESVFSKCNCPSEDRVKFATGTLEGSALTWWNTQVQMLTEPIANAMPCEEFKQIMTEEFCPRDEVRKLETELWELKMEDAETEAYTTRFHELASLCPRMVEPASLKIERYINGLVPEIQGLVTSSDPTTIHSAIRLAHKLTTQQIQQGKQTKGDDFSAQKKNKRKRDDTGHVSDSATNKGSSNYNGKLPYCDKCNKHHKGKCNDFKCYRCGKPGHTAKYCRGELLK